MTAPRLEAMCVRHGMSLPWCDHCATIQVMRAWTAALSGEELASALEAICDHRLYNGTERRAILAEAARRARLCVR